VRSQLLPHTSAHVPAVAQLEREVELLGRGLESQVLHFPVGLGVQLEALAQGQMERAAEMLEVGERGEPGRRIAGFEVLRVERQARVGSGEEVAESHAEIRTVTIGLRTAERQSIVAHEAETAIIGVQ
jgi:hypothetical protein